MKNILFTSKNTTKFFSILLSTAFSMIAATSGEASKSHKFIEYDASGYPVTNHYTTPRGVEYNLSDRTMNLRSSPSKNLWNAVNKKRKGDDIDAILESPTKRMKVTPVGLDLNTSFDNASREFTSSCAIITEEEPQMFFIHAAVETVAPVFAPLHMAEETTDTLSFTPSVSSFTHDNNRDARLAYVSDVLASGKTIRRMAEHFEMLEELNHDTSEFHASYSPSIDSEDESDMEVIPESTNEVIYDFGIDSFKRAATPRNLALAAGVATGAALAYQFCTDGFGMFANEVATTAPSFFASAANTTLGFCPVQEVCTAVYPNMTTSFVSNVSTSFVTETFVPQTFSFAQGVCEALPYSNSTGNVVTQTVMPQVIETVTEAGSGFWNFLNNAFINMNKNSHL